MNGQKKLGLALGAGAARGFAHIGVIQVLLENDIEISCVSGCSMGALIGALYATGTDMYFLEKYARSFDLIRYVDLTLKRGGFLGGARIERLIEVLTKNRDFDQTRLPYACVAVDIEDGSVKTFTTGRLSQAVRASISMPGIFIPHAIDGRTYIDGGVLERLPVKAARGLGADIVLGVDVAYRGWEQKPPKNVVETIMFTLNICDWNIARNKIKEADVLLLPDVEKVEPLSVKDAERCVKAGRECMEEHMEELKAAITQ